MGARQLQENAAGDSNFERPVARARRNELKEAIKNAEKKIEHGGDNIIEGEDNNGLEKVLLTQSFFFLTIINFLLLSYSYLFFL